MTHGEPLTHNMLSGASSASPFCPNRLDESRRLSLSPSLPPWPCTRPGISGAYLDATHFLNI